MSHVSGTVVTFVPNFRTGARNEWPTATSNSRFTPLLSRRETWVAMKGKAGEARTFSAICFPGWDRG
jgi:hypothetical protein